MVEKGAQLTLFLFHKKRKPGIEKKPGVDALRRNVEISMNVMYTRPLHVFGTLVAIYSGTKQHSEKNGGKENEQRNYQLRRVSCGRTTAS